MTIDFHHFWQRPCWAEETSVKKHGSPSLFRFMQSQKKIYQLYTSCLMRLIFSLLNSQRKVKFVKQLDTWAFMNINWQINNKLCKHQWNNYSFINFPKSKFFNISIVILMLFDDCFHMNNNGLNGILGVALHFHATLIYTQKKPGKPPTHSFFTNSLQSKKGATNYIKIKTRDKFTTVNSRFSYKLFRERKFWMLFLISINVQILWEGHTFL